MLRAVVIGLWYKTPVYDLIPQSPTVLPPGSDFVLLGKEMYIHAPDTAVIKITRQSYYLYPYRVCVCVCVCVCMCVCVCVCVCVCLCVCVLTTDSSI